MFRNLEAYDYLIRLIDEWEGGQAAGVARWVVENLAPKSVVDIGCASGLYLLPFLEEGVKVLGVDGAPTAGQKLPPENYWRHDLREPLVLPEVYDVCLCLETAEHIETEFTDVFVKSLAGVAKTIVFSAARPGQGGELHYNEQPKEYWLEKLAAYGFGLHHLSDAFRAHVGENPGNYYHPWLIENGMVLERL